MVDNILRNSEPKATLLTKQHLFLIADLRKSYVTATGNPLRPTDRPITPMFHFEGPKTAVSNMLHFGHVGHDDQRPVVVWKIKDGVRKGMWHGFLQEQKVEWNNNVLYRTTQNIKSKRCHDIHHFPCLGWPEQALVLYFFPLCQTHSQFFLVIKLE